jgi:hypothetical protein
MEKSPALGDMSGSWLGSATNRDKRLATEANWRSVGRLIGVLSVRLSVTMLGGAGGCENRLFATATRSSLRSFERADIWVSICSLIWSRAEQHETSVRIHSLDRNKSTHVRC